MRWRHDALTHPMQILDPNNSVAPLAARANAAMVDIAVVGGIASLVYWFAAFAEPARPNAAWGFVVVLGLLALVEMFSGVTIGKLMFHLSVRTADGRPPPVIRLIWRALVRWMPVTVFMPSVLVKNQLTGLSIVLAALIVACSYVATCYLLLVRKDKTLFDAAAGTIVIGRPAVTSETA